MLPQLVAALTALAVAPVPDGTAPDEDAARADAAALRTRAALELPEAVLAKPRMDPNGLDPYQAPLLYLAAPTDEPDAAVAPPAAAVRDGEALAADGARPTVYFVERRRELPTGDVREVDFAWLRALGADGAPAAQGVRITYDRSGRPAVVEALHDSGARAPLWVSSAVEAAAADAHGDPPPGALFAVESDLPDRAPAVVVDTFETGPMAMGPYLYFDAGSNDVAALHCRCSPSRVERIRETVEYDLVPLEELDERLVRSLHDALGGPPPEHRAAFLRAAVGRVAR